MKRKGMFLLGALCLFVNSVNSVYAVTNDTVTNDAATNKKVVSEESSDTEPGIFVLNSFSGDIIEADLEDYSFTEDRVSFTYQDKLFNFSLEKYEMKDTRVDGVEYYLGNEGDLDCYVVVYEGSVCIKVTDTAQSVAGRQKDMLNNFTVVAFDSADGNLGEISDMMKTMEEKSTK